MFGLGFIEILILILIAFLVFGPEQFPVVAKNFIKLLNELRRAFTEVKSEFYDVQTETEKHLQQITDFAAKDVMSIKDSIKKEFSSFNPDPSRKDKNLYSKISFAKENSDNIKSKFKRNPKD